MPSAARQRFLAAVTGGRALMIAAIFLATAATVFFVGLYFAPPYVATAMLMRVSPMTAAEASASADDASMASASSLIGDDLLIGIDSRLYPRLVNTYAESWALARTRRHITVATVTDATSRAEKLRVTFADRDKETALRVTNALAAALTQAPAHISTTGESVGDSRPTLATPSPPSSQKSAESAQAIEIQKTPVTLSALRYRLDEAMQSQTTLEQQIEQQWAALAAVQREHDRITASSKETVAVDHERQLSKHQAAEAELRSQLAAAAQTMNDLGQRYTADYPEYINAKDRVEELQSGLNQFLTKPFTFVSEATADNSRRIAELSQQEIAIKATLLILQQELDHNQIESRRVQALISHWSPANAVQSSGNTGPNTTVSSATNPLALEAGPSHSYARRIGFTILQDARILSPAPPLNLSMLAAASLLAGLITSSGTALLIRTPNKIIRGEEDLANELPERTQYLGGIPRIKHEIIPR